MNEIVLITDDQGFQAVWVLLKFFYLYAFEIFEDIVLRLDVLIPLEV